MLIRAQRERGIRTWQDVLNLDEEHTSTEIRRVLEDAGTANAVMWITPDVADSSVIQRVEAPCIMRRAEAGDSFFVIPVAAGGADYETAARAAGENLSLTNLKEWNIRRVQNDPASDFEVREIVCRLLERRVRSINAYLSPDEPITIGLFVRAGPPVDDKLWLALDWTSRFEKRNATEASWNRHLLPALKDVVDAIGKHAPGRRIVASGFPSIGAAFALGRTFLAPRRFDVSWNQFTAGVGEANWSLNERAQEVELKTSFRDSDTTAEDLAVLVSISAAVEHAWAATDSLPAFRGIVDVRCEGTSKHSLTPGQAVMVAKKTVEVVRAAREDLRPRGPVHFFMAGPVGIAFLIGQLSNTLGPVRLYEHDESDAVGHYVSGPELS